MCCLEACVLSTLQGLSMQHGAQVAQLCVQPSSLCWLLAAGCRRSIEIRFPAHACGSAYSTLDAKVLEPAMHGTLGFPALQMLYQRTSWMTQT